MLQVIKEYIKESKENRRLRKFDNSKFCRKHMEYVNERIVEREKQKI